MGEDLCQQVSELETIVNFFLILGNLKMSCELKWCYELGFRFEKPLGGLAKGSKNTSEGGGVTSDAAEAMVPGPHPAARSGPTVF